MPLTLTGCPLAWQPFDRCGWYSIGIGVGVAAREPRVRVICLSFVPLICAIMCDRNCTAPPTQLLLALEKGMARGELECDIGRGRRYKLYMCACKRVDIIMSVTCHAKRLQGTAGEMFPRTEQ